MSPAAMMQEVVPRLHTVTLSSRMFLPLPKMVMAAPAPSELPEPFSRKVESFRVKPSSPFSSMMMPLNQSMLLAVTFTPETRPFSNLPPWTAAGMECSRSTSPLTTIRAVR